MPQETTIVITDPALAAQVEAARDFIMFRDPAGRLLSVVTTRVPGSPTDEQMAMIKPLTTEELAERRKQPTITHQDMIAELRARNLCTT